MNIENICNSCCSNVDTSRRLVRLIFDCKINTCASVICVLSYCITDIPLLTLTALSTSAGGEYQSYPQYAHTPQYAYVTDPNWPARYAGKWSSWMNTTTSERWQLCRTGYIAKFTCPHVCLCMRTYICRQFKYAINQSNMTPSTIHACTRVCTHTRRLHTCMQNRGHKWLAYNFSHLKVSLKHYYNFKKLLILKQTLLYL